MTTYQPAYEPARTTSLAELLDRVLDKGLVVAGDIRISLGNVELLTIKIRLLICSLDKAEQIGLNWWRYDRNLVHPEREPGALPEGEASQIAQLEARIAELEQLLTRRLARPSRPAPAAPRQRRST
jgi:Gas vesicle protein